MSEPFERQLHPSLRERLGHVLQDLRARGWNPVVPEVFGKEGTGFRSVAAQQALRKSNPKRTSVKFSFHNVTDAAGRPQSMAVHITDPSVGKNPKRGHPFLEDLQAISERHGLRTGNTWKDPWDPLHVQLLQNSALKQVRAGRTPPLLDARLRLMPPRFGNPSIPSALPPRSFANFAAGERFKLTSTFGQIGSRRPADLPLISRHDIEAGRRLELSARQLGDSFRARRPGPPPLPTSVWTGRRPSLGNFQLRRPDLGMRPSASFNPGQRMTLTPPSFKLPSPAAPSLGNFTLRRPSL